MRKEFDYINGQFVDARNEAVYAAEITRYHAEWARRIEGEIIPSDNADETININAPTMMAAEKGAASILQGNP